MVSLRPLDIAANAVFARAAGVTAHPLAEELVVLEGEGEMIRGLNPTGRRIFELVDGSRSSLEMAKHLASERRLDAEAIFPDVVAFLAELERHGLLVRVEER